MEYSSRPRPSWLNRRLLKAAFEQSINLNGVAERTLLSEAALQALLSMDPEKVPEECLLEYMKDTVDKLKPVVKKVTPRLTVHLAEPALSIALDYTGKMSRPEE